MANCLALETTSPVLSVALNKGEGAVSEDSLKGYFSHAENLLPMIDRLLQNQNMSSTDVDTFLIGQGPGSFTGLRVGYATLKGFLAVRQRESYGALSLDAIAEGVVLENGSHLGVLLDARRERIYARFYTRRNHRWVAKVKTQVLTLSECAAKFPSEIHLTGDALGRYGEDFRKKAEKKKLIFLPDSLWYPRASTLISWYVLNHEKGPEPGTRRSPGSPLKRLEKEEDFLPLYFRRSEAEEKKRDKRHAHHA